MKVWRNAVTCHKGQLHVWREPGTGQVMVELRIGRDVVCLGLTGQESESLVADLETAMGREVEAARG